MTDRKVEFKNKTSIADLGSGAAILAQPETVTRLLLGEIVGIAEKLSIRTRADKVTVDEGLSGTFEAVSLIDTAKPIVRSGVLYLPDGIHAVIRKGMNINDEGTPTAVVSFGFDVYAIRATNAAKYSYSFEPKFQPKAADDPIAMLRKRIEDEKQAALTDQSGADDQGAATPAAAGKGKAKA